MEALVHLKILLV